MASNAPFFRGQNVKLRCYQNNKPVTFLCKNWEVEENAEEVNDGVNGEYRDRLDKVTNYFSGSVDLFQNDQEQMDAIIAAQEADDAAGFPLPQTLAVQIQQRDGTRAAYICTEAKLGPWKTGMTSRADAQMVTLKFRFRFWKKVPAI